MSQPAKPAVTDPSARIRAAIDSAFRHVGLTPPRIQPPDNSVFQVTPPPPAKARQNPPWRAKPRQLIQFCKTKPTPPPPRHHPAKARQTTPTRPIHIKSAKQSQLHPPANLVPSPPTISAPRACWSPVKPPPRSPLLSPSIAIPSLTGNDSPHSSARSAVSSMPHLPLPSPIPIVVRRSKRRYPIGTGKLIL
jgi:hypothetical protein